MKTPWIPEIKPHTQQQQGVPCEKKKKYILLILLTCLTLLTFGASGRGDCGTSKCVYCEDKEILVTLGLHVPNERHKTHGPITEEVCPATTCLCMCKLHLFRRCGFCCRGRSLWGCLDISLHTDSHSKSSATVGTVGYLAQRAACLSHCKCLRQG